MLTGQTQKRFGENEDPLEPRSIQDIKTMLNASGHGARIKNHKILSGIMFFEVQEERDIKRLGRKSYVRHYLVAGEDPNDEGCVAAISLSDEERQVQTTHMSALNDTRGGISNVAWCSSLQLRRKILRNGKSSRSYTAIRSVRRDYCEALLLEFDDLVPFKNQNWQAIQNIINRHQHLLYDEDDQPRPEAMGDEPDNDDHDQDDYHDDDYGRDNVIDRDSDMEDDTINDNQNHFDQYHSRSPSISFIPHFRSSSPEVIDTDDNDDDYDDIDIDSTPTRDDSNFDDDILIISDFPKQPKLEPKVEPDPEVTTTNGTAMVRSTKNFIDLTGEPDTEVIDLTGSEDSVVNRTSSGVELIELEG
ncbi:hypothetical protein KCU85_g883, partial [Aureobasidium melanogenum]